jgi:hypothetical protein
VYDANLVAIAREHVTEVLESLEPARLH